MSTLDINGIKFTITIMGDIDTVLLHSICEDKELSEQTAQGIATYFPRVRETKVEWVEPWTHVRPNGEERQMGGYYSLVCKLGLNQMSAITQTAESIAQKYDYIGKLDFLKEVKKIEGVFGKDGIRMALDVWNKYYAD